MRAKGFLVCTAIVDPRIRGILFKLGLDVQVIAGVDLFLDSCPAETETIVLVDVAADQERGLAHVEKILSRRDNVIVIPICENCSIEFCRRCFIAGAADVLDKSFDDQRIVQALETSRAGMSLKAKRLLIGRHRQTRFSSLTEREREVFRLLLDGLTNREIAEALSLSARTVEVHRAHLQQKLDTRNVAQLARRYGVFVEESLVTLATELR